MTHEDHDLYPFSLKSGGTKEHLRVAGKSGIGKTDLSFMLVLGVGERESRYLLLTGSVSTEFIYGYATARVGRSTESVEPNMSL